MLECPIAARCTLAAALALAAVAASPAAAEPPAAALTEAEAVRRALGRPAVADAARARVDLARADELAARRWPNPEASWSHEAVRADGGGTAREDVALLSQRLDLSGRRGLRGGAAASRVEAARAEGELAALDLEAEARRAFAAALAGERRVATLRSALERLDGVASSVARRAASGDVAGYDRRRIERERAGALARLEAEEGAAARARARLAGLVGADPSAPPAVEGELGPGEPPPLAALAARLPARPDLRALELEARSGELEARAARRWLVPELELGAGLKRVDDGAGGEAGFAAALTVPLPLFSRDQDERLRGDARARAARARHALELDAARAELAGLHAEATRLAGAALRWRASGAGDSAALLRSAEAAYRGGEAGVLELVDGYRAAVEADLALVELEWAARRARVELDRTSGGASP